MELASSRVRGSQAVGVALESDEIAVVREAVDHCFGDGVVAEDPPAADIRMVAISKARS